jgi:uncharacterized protein DUF1839
VIAARAGATPVEHAPHFLHADSSLPWPVSNCYVDMWIETLHWLELDPVAGMAFTLSADFEGDQWTLVKQPPHDLYVLYGIDVVELNAWRSVEEHVVEQLGRGRMVAVEADSYYLPDTSATAYRRRHEKTTVAIPAIDTEARLLRYFHDAAFHELDRGDFDGFFSWGRDPQDLPPYFEIAKLDGLRRLDDDELRAAAAALARSHLERLPRDNPFERYAERYDSDVAALLAAGTDHNDYVFASVRQAGAAFQYAAVFLDWLGEGRSPELARAGELLLSLSETLKAVLMKTARGLARGRTPEAATLLAGLAEPWREAVEAVGEGLAVTCEPFGAG